MVLWGYYVDVYCLEREIMYYTYYKGPTKRKSCRKRTDLDPSKEVCKNIEKFGA